MQKTTLYENWVQGDHVKSFNSMNIKDITGDYTLSVNNKTYDLTISGKGNKQTGSM